MSEKAEDVALSVGWDGQSANVKVRSRWLSAYDRLFGLKADKAGLVTSNEVDVSRALTKSRVTLIEAATAAVAKQISENPEQAQKALTIFNRMSVQFDNVGAIMELVADELKALPALSTPSSDKDPDTLDEDLLNRWSHYAGEASSDQAREKWARVLASEIRAPGTFTVKALRVIDEIDPEVARLFERFCMSRIGRWVPQISHGLSQGELERLGDADLIREDDLPRSVPFNETTRGDGSKWWIHLGTEFGVVVRVGAPLRFDPKVYLSDPLRLAGDALIMNVLVFTDTGEIVASIAPTTAEGAFRRLVSGLLKYGDQPDVKLLKKVEGVGFLDIEEAEQRSASEK
jgi:hypothetical protein